MCRCIVEHCSPERREATRHPSTPLLMIVGPSADTGDDGMPGCGHITKESVKCAGHAGICMNQELDSRRCSTRIKWQRLRRGRFGMTRMRASLLARFLSARIADNKCQAFEAILASEEGSGACGLAKGLRLGLQMAPRFCSGTMNKDSSQ